MDIEQVACVVELVESSQLYQVTIANNGQSIKVVNNLNKKGITDTTKKMPTHNVGNGSSKPVQVLAMYVGKVYLSEDDSIGNVVNKGQTICFIDELNRLLPVISDKEGTISATLVKNGQNIEYGQPIFDLEIQ